MKKAEIDAYLYVLIATTLWGFSGVVAKHLFDTGISPGRLVQVRISLAALILFLALLIFSRERLLIAARDIPYFLVFGIIGLAGSQFSFYFTVSKIQVGPAVLIQYLCAAWVTLYAYLFRGEPLSKRMVFALFLAVSGCYLVAGGYRFDLLRLNTIGLAGGLASSFFVAFYTLASERGLERYDAWTVLLYGLGAGALFYSFLNSPLKVFGQGYPLTTWLLFLYISLFATLLPFAFFFKGVERIRVTRASITANWEPVMAGLSAYLVLGEVLEPLQVLGGLGVMAAVVLLQLGKPGGGPVSAFDIRNEEKG